MYLKYLIIIENVTSAYKEVPHGNFSQMALAGEPRGGPMIQLQTPRKQEFTMLQANEVARRFGAIEQAIGQAAQLCGKQQGMPMDLKDCLDQLDQQKNAVRQAIDMQDDARIRQAVDQMESLGDRAKQACGTASSLTPEMKSAVLKVHDELSDLKHQLH